MKKIIFGILTFIVMSHSKLEIADFQFGGFLEFGELRNTNFITEDPRYSLDDYFYRTTPVNRTIGWIRQEATIDERLNVALSMGGVFFYAYPLGEFESFNRIENNRKFALSLDEIVTSYKWGDIQNPFAKIKVGLFYEKYNKDSRNLGEYLFRSKAYPNLVYNGTWTSINSSRAQMWGMKFTLGKETSRWKNDFYLTASDITYPPLFDFSLSYITKYDFGAIEIGGGVSLDHLLAVSPSLSSPKIRTDQRGIEPAQSNLTNAWVELPEFQYVSRDDTISISAGTYHGSSESFLKDLILQDTSFFNSIVGDDKREQLRNVDVNYFTYKSTKVMGMASVNISELVYGTETNNDLKIYSEVAVLGVKNYPIFYESMKERTLIMGGVNIPTFGILDKFSIEVEHWKNPYYNDNYESRNTNYPIPQDVPVTDSTEIHSDDWKWSVFLQKNISKYMRTFLQVANDHSRPVLYNYTPANSSVFVQRKSWYYLFGLEFSI